MYFSDRPGLPVYQQWWKYRCVGGDFEAIGFCYINQRENLQKINMAKKVKKTAAADEEIISKIYLIRNKKIMLDKDLAQLYDITTGNLNKAVKRNIKRFPVDFMF